MSNKKDRAFKSVALLSAISALVYIWFYNFYFEPNPLYGDRASTASNVGRDHWVAFIVWGLLLEAAFLINLLYSLKKFNVPSKVPRVFGFISLFGAIGFVLCKNEKLNRFTFTLGYEQYDGTPKMSYDEQILVSSKDLFSIFWSKKSMHSAFSVIFGVCIAIGVMYLLIYKSRRSKKFRRLALCFVMYIAVAACVLKNFLGGPAEMFAITTVLIPMMIINTTDIMLDDEIVIGQGQFIENGVKN